MKHRGTLVLRDRQRWVYRLLEPGPWEKILEVGCATGYLSGVLKTLTRELVSIDINPLAIREARRTVRDVDFLVCPAERLDFKQSRFDAVVFLDVLEHTLDPAKAIDQIRGKMKKNGRLFLSVPHRGLFGFLDVDNLKRSAMIHCPGLYRWLYERVTRKKIGALQVPPLHRHYSLEGIRVLLGGGYRIEKSCRRGLLLYPLGLVLDPFVKRLPLFGKEAHELLNWLMDVDFRLPYGVASYNLLVLAVKK